MRTPPRYTAAIAMVSARLIGGLSLLGFAAFLFVGSFSFVHLSRNHWHALAIDGFMCVVFFAQHSGMVRRSFQSRIEWIVPRIFQGTMYTIVSGLTLAAVIILWQPTDVLVVSIPSPFRWILRALSVASILGFVWGTRSLKSLDAIGAVGIRAHLRGESPRETPLTLQGPYRWVRHPLYFFVLVLIWAMPDITTDRLLFNIAFTLWIIIGSKLEERDLVADFGDAYRRYQTQVPMLIPTRWPMRKDSPS